MVASPFPFSNFQFHFYFIFCIQLMMFSIFSEWFWIHVNKKKSFLIKQSIIFPIMNTKYNGTNILTVLTSSLSSSHSPSFISSNSLISNYYLNSSTVYFSLIIAQSTDFLPFYRLWVCLMLFFFFSFLRPWIKVKMMSLHLNILFWSGSHALVFFSSNFLSRRRLCSGVCSICSLCSDDQCPNESRLFPFTLFLLHSTSLSLSHLSYSKWDSTFFCTIGRFNSIHFANVCYTLLVASVNIICVLRIYRDIHIFFLFQSFTFDINSAVRTNQKWIKRVEKNRTATQWNKI